MARNFGHRLNNAIRGAIKSAYDAHPGERVNMDSITKRVYGQVYAFLIKEGLLNKKAQKIYNLGECDLKTPNVDFTGNCWVTDIPDINDSYRLLRRKLQRMSKRCNKLERSIKTKQLKIMKLHVQNNILMNRLIEDDK